MNRKKAVEKAYQRGALLSLGNEAYRERVEAFLKTKLDYDKRNGDLTAEAVIKNDMNIGAIIRTEEQGIVAGIEEICAYYKSNGIVAIKYAHDGDEVEAGQDLIYLEGNAQKIITMERLGLNVLRTMSGIATKTREYADLLADYPAQIAATRKFRQEDAMDKKAVYLGGGLTHRLGLYDSVMIKDCHLDIIGMEGIEHPVRTAIERAYQAPHGNSVEVEVNTLLQAIEAAETFYKVKPTEEIGVIMFDNMAPWQIKEALDVLKRRNLYDGLLFEASGGINLSTVVEYAKTGVDVISTSDITEGSKRLNIHQKIMLEKKVECLIR